MCLQNIHSVRVTKTDVTVCLVTVFEVRAPSGVCGMTRVSHTQNTSSPVSTCVFVEHREHSEDEGTECGSKVSSPVVSHSKVRRCYLYTEEHTWWRTRKRISNERGRKWEQCTDSHLKTGMLKNNLTLNGLQISVSCVHRCQMINFLQVNMAISHAFWVKRCQNNEDRKAVYLRVEYQSSSPPQQHSPLSGCLCNSMDSTDPERRKRRQDWHDRKHNI